MNHSSQGAAPAGSAPPGPPQYDSLAKGCLPWVIAVIILTAAVIAGILWTGVFRK